MAPVSNRVRIHIKEALSKTIIGSRYLSFLFGVIVKSGNSLPELSDNLSALLFGFQSILVLNF